MSHDAHQKAAFFRQSGWLMLAGIASGTLMLGIHFLSKLVPIGEYGTVGKMLAVTIIIPMMPFQMVFARETAAALALGNTRALVGLIRKMLAGLFGVWLLIAAVALWFQADILMHWKVTEPLTLWLLLLVILGSMTIPLFNGALQGSQNFLWLGWTMIANGGFRVLVSVLLVLLVAKTAASIMTGVLAGLVITGGLAIWQTRPIWSGPSEPFKWGPTFRQMLPLMIGFTACQFLFSADTIFVGVFFSADETGYYAAAGTLARAIIWLVMPLATVMFPKLVHSAAKSEKSNVMLITLVSTAVLGILGAVGLVILGPFVVKTVFTDKYVATAIEIIPWYAGAMIPLSLANVLVNNLLAKLDFRIVPWLAALAIGYAVALNVWHPTLTSILISLGTFTTLLFVVSAAYTWGPLARPAVVKQPD